MENFRSVWTYLYETEFTLGRVDANGVKTRYLEAGPKNAPTVVLIHGTAGSLENFCANIAEYAKHFHVYAYDMVGCGLSEKPDYSYTVPVYAEHARHFMDALGIRTASFVGVSLGSWVAARLAVNCPERVEKIIMIAAAGIIVDQKDWEDVIAGVRERRTAAAEMPTWQSIKKIFEHLILKPENIIDEIVALRLSIYSKPELRRAMPNLLGHLGGEGMLSEDEWRSLEQPLLVAHAVDHPDMFLKNGRRIVEICPNARAVDIHGCDHWAQFESPDEFNPFTIEFLNETLEETRAKKRAAGH